MDLTSDGKLRNISETEFMHDCLIP